MTGALNTIAQSSDRLYRGKREAEAQIEAKIKSTLDTTGIGQQIQQLQQQVTNLNTGIAQAPVVPPNSQQHNQHLDREQRKTQQWHKLLV